MGGKVIQSTSILATFRNVADSVKEKKLDSTEVSFSGNKLRTVSSRRGVANPQARNEELAAKKQLYSAFRYRAASGDFLNHVLDSLGLKIDGGEVVEDLQHHDKPLTARTVRNLLGEYDRGSFMKDGKSVDALEDSKLSVRNDESGWTILDGAEKTAGIFLMNPNPTPKIQTFLQTLPEVKPETADFQNKEWCDTFASSVKSSIDELLEAPELKGATITSSFAFALIEGVRRLCADDNRCPFADGLKAFSQRQVGGGPENEDYFRSLESSFMAVKRSLNVETKQGMNVSALMTAVLTVVKSTVKKPAQNDMNAQHGAVMQRQEAPVKGKGAVRPTIDKAARKRCLELLRPELKKREFNDVWIEKYEDLCSVLSFDLQKIIDDLHRVGIVSLDDYEAEVLIYDQAMANNKFSLALKELTQGDRNIREKVLSELAEQANLASDIHQMLIKAIRSYAEIQ